MDLTATAGDVDDDPRADLQPDPGVLDAEGLQDGHGEATARQPLPAAVGAGRPGPAALDRDDHRHRREGRGDAARRVAADGRREHGRCVQDWAVPTASPPRRSGRSRLRSTTASRRSSPAASTIPARTRSRTIDGAWPSRGDARRVHAAVVRARPAVDDAARDRCEALAGPARAHRPGQAVHARVPGEVPPFASCTLQR